MIPRSLRMVSVCGVFGLAAILLTPGESRAGFHVAAGYDLFQTDSSGTSITGLGNLMGVPLGTYNFGGSIGVQNVGNADTIIQRTMDVTGSGAGSTGSSPLVMQALQLETMAPINFMGLGLTNYFVTLQSVRGGTASTGSINITFDSTGLAGTFTSSIDVFYDIRIGSINGTIVASGDQTLVSDPPTWSSVAPSSSTLTIPGVNGDFFPNEFTEADLIAMHRVLPASVPEPASILMLGIGTIGMGIYGWRRRVRAA